MDGAKQIEDDTYKILSMIKTPIDKNLFLSDQLGAWFRGDNNIKLLYNKYRQPVPEWVVVQLKAYAYRIMAECLQVIKIDSNDRNGSIYNISYRLNNIYRLANQLRTVSSMKYLEQAISLINESGLLSEQCKSEHRLKMKKELLSCYELASRLLIELKQLQMMKY